MVKIVIDMMGGDNGTKATITATEKILNEYDDIEIVAVGDEKELSVFSDNPRVKIISSQSIVPMECSVLQAMRMKDSSVYKAVNAVKEENADAVLSAGSTGAFLALTTLINKKIEGVERPALVTAFPTRIPNKNVVFLDVGASADNSADDLVQFAIMGEAYSRVIYGVEKPKTYLISNGTEEGKGNAIIKEAYSKMKSNPSFMGYIEGRNVLSGEADVVVFDGFTGNVFLKGTEGVAKMLGDMMKNAFTKSFSSKIGYLFARKGIKELRSLMDYKKVGGAMLLGVNTVAVKAHGNSDQRSFYNSIKVAYTLAKNKVVDQIKENLKQWNQLMNC